jgi:hypothetical protein
VSASSAAVGTRMLLWDEIQGEPSRASTQALSDQISGPSLTVVASGHERPVPVFQQLARSDPSGRDDVREIVACEERFQASLSG